MKPITCRAKGRSWRDLKDHHHLFLRKEDTPRGKISKEDAQQVGGEGKCISASEKEEATLLTLTLTASSSSIQSASPTVLSYVIASSLLDSRKTDEAQTVAPFS
jgi:hypothetical protein